MVLACIAKNTIVMYQLHIQWIHGIQIVLRVLEIMQCKNERMNLEIYIYFYHLAKHIAQ